MTGHALRGFAAILMAAALFTVPAFAQTPPAAPVVTESHQDGSWTVRCFNVATYPCDIVQASFLRSRNLKIASIDITYITQSGGYFARFVVPAGVSFDEGLTLQFGEFVSPHLKFRRCERDGCYVEGLLPPAMIAAMQAPDMSGKMHMMFMNGKKLDIPIALDGFPQGISQLRQLTAARMAARK
jgi:invasion protein IalB